MTHDLDLSFLFEPIDENLPEALVRNMKITVPGYEYVDHIYYM